MVHSATLTVDTAASPAAATTPRGSMLVLLPLLMGTLAHLARDRVADRPRTSAPYTHLVRTCGARGPHEGAPIVHPVDARRDRTSARGRPAMSTILGTEHEHELAVAERGRSR
jgi:hypothetical protein